MPNIQATKLADVLDPDALEHQIKNGFITMRQLHGSDIAVLNYTAKATYKGHWTTETRRCRGLVVNGDGAVLARPFEKFFDITMTKASLDDPFVVTEKFDGSLGILYTGPAGTAITTRGDPNSWQSKLATELWRERYEGFEPPGGVTLLFEIILPENKVVVDYGERRDLVLLAAIDNATGRDVDLPDNWEGPAVSRFYPSRSALDELVAGAARDKNREGFVLYWPDSGTRAKLKLAEYTRIHRMIFFTSTKSIWESLAHGVDPVAKTADGPPDLRRFVEAHTAALREQHDQAISAARSVVAHLSAAERADRRLAAAVIKATPAPSLAFLALDGRDADLAKAAWQAVRPGRAEMFKTEGEGE